MHFVPSFGFVEDRFCSSISCFILAVSFSFVHCAECNLPFPVMPDLFLLYFVADSSHYYPMYIYCLSLPLSVVVSSLMVCVFSESMFSTLLFPSSCPLFMYAFYYCR